MRIVVHAGMHKTGTSTIQNAYAAGTPIDLGYFPWYGANHTGLFIVLFEEEERMHEFHGFRLSGRTLEDMKALRKEWRCKTEEFLLSTTARTVLFSAEGISGPHCAAVHNLADFCRARFDNVSVISYVRPPLSYMASAFQETIKENTINNFDIQNFWPFYRSKLSLLDDAFGRENVILRKFDPAYFLGGDLISDFSACAQIPMPLGSPTRSNESLSLEAVAALYTQRSLGEGLVLDHSDLFNRNMSFVQELNKLGRTRFGFSPELLESARRTYPGDLEWAEDRIGVSLLDDSPSGCGDILISNEQDLYDVALKLADRISSVHQNLGYPSEDKKEGQKSLITIAQHLDDIRRSFYSDHHQQLATKEPEEEDLTKMAKTIVSTDTDRDIRMKIAYAVLWAQERAEHGPGASDIEAKWANEMSTRMMDAAQILFMLRQQGLEVKSVK